MKKILLFLIFFFSYSGYGEIIIPSDKVGELLEMKAYSTGKREEFFTGKGSTNI